MLSTYYIQNMLRLPVALILEANEQHEVLRNNPKDPQTLIMEGMRMSHLRSFSLLQT